MPSGGSARSRGAVPPLPGSQGSRRDSDRPLYLSHCVEPALKQAIALRHAHHLLRVTQSHILFQFCQVIVNNGNLTRALRSATGGPKLVHIMDSEVQF